MVKPVSDLPEIGHALHGVRAELRAEIAKRIAAGEAIARTEGDAVIANRQPSRDLAARRQEILEQHGISLEKRRRPDQSAA